MILQNFGKVLCCAVAAFSCCAMVGAQTAMNEPDDVKPVQISGCMTARTRSGGFILSGVFGRPVTVLGPNYLQTGMGHEVTLTGTWQANGTSALKDGKVDNSRMFIATGLKINARQCASPPSAPTTPPQPGKSSGNGG